MDGVGKHEGTAAGDDLTLGYAVAEAEPPQHGNDIQTTAGERDRGRGGGRSEVRRGVISRLKRHGRIGGREGSTSAFECGDE